MPLTPIDVQQKTFGPELRGYNMDEVDDFLDEIVSSLKDYDQRVRDAQDRIRALESELSNRGEDESAISRALVNAQKQADAIINDAVVDSQRILEEAQGEADQLRTNRETERMSLVQDIARMRATVADLKRRVLELATSIDEDLDNMDSEASQVARELETPEGDSPVFETPDPHVADDDRGPDPAHVDDSGYVVERRSDVADHEVDGPDDDIEGFEVPSERRHFGSVDDVEVGHGLDPFAGSEGRRGGHLDEASDPAELEADESAFTDEEITDEEIADEEIADEQVADEQVADEQVADEQVEDEPDEESPSDVVSGRRPWERGSV